MCRLKKARGQNLTEAALCISVITAAILGMRVYVQRSLQARYKAGPDYVFRNIEAEAREKGVGHLNNIRQQQYDPYYYQSDITENKNAVQTKYKRDGELEEGEDLDGELALDSTVTRTGWTAIGSAREVD